MFLPVVHDPVAIQEDQEVRLHARVIAVEVLHRVNPHPAIQEGLLLAVLQEAEVVVGVGK
jgi:hypothetical protein